MDRGRIADTGTHAELLARNGLYADCTGSSSSGDVPEPLPDNDSSSTLPIPDTL